jgi:hypothetical protein
MIGQATSSVTKVPMVYTYEDGEAPLLNSIVCGVVNGGVIMTADEHVTTKLMLISAVLPSFAVMVNL